MLYDVIIFLRFHGKLLIILGVMEEPNREKNLFKTLMAWIMLHLPRVSE